MSGKRDRRRAEAVFEDRTEPSWAGWGDPTAFVASARELLRERPDDRTEARHLAAIRAAIVEDRTDIALGSVLLIPKRRLSFMDRTKPVLAKLAVAVATLTGSTAGLAYAGVDLPGRAAEKAFEAVGVDLPNQGDETADVTESIKQGTTNEVDGKSVSGFVRSLIEGWEGERGCEFGQAVSEVASQNSRGEPQGTGQSKDPCDRGDDTVATDDTETASGGSQGKGPSTTGAEKSAEGKSKAEENKSNAGPKGGQSTGGGSTGAEKSAEGKSKAEENKSNAGTNESGGDAEGDSEQGQSTATDRPGAPPKDE